jgi:hypothetical protein
MLKCKKEFYLIKNNTDKITSKGIYVHYFRWNELSNFHYIAKVKQIFYLFLLFTIFRIILCKMFKITYSNIINHNLNIK